MEKRRKINPVKRNRDNYNPINRNREKALTIVGAFYAYSQKANSQINILGLHRGQIKSPLRNMLQGIGWKVKLKNFTEITKKTPL